MKKILLLATATILLMACSKEDSTPQNLVEEGLVDVPVFYASTDSSPASGTKVYINEDVHLRWNADDRITVFGAVDGTFKPKTVNSQFKFTGEDGDSGGNFEYVAPTIPSFSAGSDLSTYYAVYPYSSTTSINESAEITLTLPSEQTYKAGSFGIGSNTMVAVSENAQSFFLPFKNVCGWLRFNFYGDNIRVRKITIEGNNGEKIAGKAKVIPGTEPSTTMDGSATGVITLNCPDVLLGSSSTSATSFIIAIPPTVFSGGFKVTITDNLGGVFEKTTVNSNTIKRNKFLEMPAMAVTPTYTGVNVVFEDETFKAYCVANFDTGGDGEISIDEALAVTEMNCFNASSSHEYTYVIRDGVRYDFIYASSLKGIEEFKNLQLLNVSGSTSVQGPLTSLDLSQNTALQRLCVNFNDISSLNIEGLSQLKGLECCYTRLPEIDVYGFANLEYLDATHNDSLKVINLSQCTSLTEIDIEGTLNLRSFECANTKLTELNLSYQPHLSYVNCSNCSLLEELDLSESKVSNSITWANCPAIKKFLFGNTRLATWPAEDFAGFSYLEEVDLYGSNYAGILDLSDKGHLKKLDAGNNQLLTGITVAERAPIEDFECAYSGVTSLDIERLSLLNNFNCANCEDLESLTVKNCKISNSVAWTGCDELKTLNLYGTEIISWPAGDFNVFPALENLNISYTNYDYALDMSCNGGLKSLECEKAGISSINVSGLPELVFINCSKNSGLTSLNLSGLARLKALDCRECSISTLNLTGCSALFNLYCAQNNIETLDLQPCTSLQELDCSLNKVGTLDIHYCSLLNALKAWPQSEGYNLQMVVLTRDQSDNIDNGTLKLYDTNGLMTEAEMWDRYHTVFDMH